MGHEGRVFLPHQDRYPGCCSHSRPGDVVMLFEHRGLCSWKYRGLDPSPGWARVQPLLLKLSQSISAALRGQDLKSYRTSMTDNLSL